MEPSPREASVHELSIAQSVLDTIVDQAREHRAGRVTAIRLRVGELTAIVEEALTFSFEILARDTCAAGALLSVETIPWQVRCPDCTHEYRVVDGMPTCPRCHRVGGETITGRELQIVEMDVE